MTTPLISVAFDGPVTTARHAATIAGLPARFRTASRASDADILVVDGTTSDWPAACRDAGAVLVDRPRAVDGDLPHRTLAFADTGYTSDPAWTAELPRIRASLDDTVNIVESTVSVADPDELPDGLLSQLTLVRALLGDIGTPSPSIVTPRRDYLLTATAGGTLVSLSGVVGPAGLVLATVGPAERWHITMHLPDTARPARLTHFTADGDHTVRPRFESSRRALWRTIHHTLSGTGAAAHQLADALPDLATTASVLAGDRGPIPPVPSVR